MEINNVESQMRVLIDELINTTDKGANINRLLHIRSQISGLSVYFAEEVGNMKELFLEGKNIYESTKMEKRYDLITQGRGNGDSSDISRRMTINEYEQMNRAEAMHNRMYLLLRQYNEVLAALNQRISFLQKEWQLNNHR